MTIESLTEEVKQFNKGFRLWKETSFKELSDGVVRLVVETDSLVESSRSLRASSKSLLDSILELEKHVLQLVELTNKEE